MEVKLLVTFEGVSVNGFYLLIYLTPLRTLSPSPLDLI